MMSQNFFQIIWPVHVHLKTDKVDLKKATVKKKNCIFFQSTHQVGMKNVVECYKDFFGYFNTRETYSALQWLVQYSKNATYRDIKR